MRPFYSQNTAKISTKTNTSQRDLLINRFLFFHLVDQLKSEQTNYSYGSVESGIDLS